MPTTRIALDAPVGQKRSSVSVATVCTVLVTLAGLAGLYAELRMTTAAQAERVDAIGRELARDREQAREFRGDVRSFQGDLRIELRRLFDKLDGKADRPTPR